MTTDKSKRKLVAVVHADVKAYKSILDSCYLLFLRNEVIPPEDANISSFVLIEQFCQEL